MESLPLAADLPPELERRIFETCALSRPVGIPTLMLVAWRVKEWVEPLLYNTITVGYTASMKDYPLFTWKPLLAAIRSKPASFFAGSVHNLNLYLEDTTQAESLLSVCLGIQNLSIVCKHDGDDRSVLESLVPVFSLGHLYVDPTPLFNTLPPTHSVFSNITHLEIKSYSEPKIASPGIWARLTLLPRLTHLSFMYDFSIPLCLDFLETCKSLSVLIALGNLAFRADFTALAHDVRFVCMQRDHFLKDWQMGIHAGIDFWSRAEDFIAKRRSGEIDARQYAILEDQSTEIE